ncbi:hypothetical protein EAS62_31380 [Bradyrhizobium zhanjiangense]|nr:hypothetical protein EAS62_31380 [Bradyrhizobium zhanjiangense]
MLVILAADDALCRSTSLRTMEEKNAPAGQVFGRREPVEMRQRCFEIIVRVLAPALLYFRMSPVSGSASEAV